MLCHLFLCKRTPRLIDILHVNNLDFVQEVEGYTKLEHFLGFSDTPIYILLNTSGFYSAK